MWHGRLFTVIGGFLLAPLGRRFHGRRGACERTMACAPRGAGHRRRRRTASGWSVGALDQPRALSPPAGSRRTAVRERARRLHGWERRAVRRPRVRLAGLGGGRVLVRARTTCSRSTPARRRASSACGRAVRRLVSSTFPPGAFPSGIAFDRFGRFGYRLLVTATFENNTRTTLYAIDCLARLSVIAQGRRTWKVESWLRRRPSGVSAAS